MTLERVNKLHIWRLLFLAVRAFVLLDVFLGILFVVTYYNLRIDEHVIGYQQLHPCPESSPARCKPCTGILMLAPVSTYTLNTNFVTPSRKTTICSNGRHGY